MNSSNQQGQCELVADHLQESANILMTFAAIYLPQLAPVLGNVSYPQSYLDPIAFVIHVRGTWITENEREETLAKVGDVFGRDGWAAVLNATRTHFDWVKIVDNMTVRLANASVISVLPSATPVSPDRFPQPQVA